MKIIVSGSLGHISKPLTEELIKQGHKVTVISSNAERQKDIEALDATAAIGSLEDVDFITKTFTGSGAAYCMIPPADYRNNSLDLTAHVKKIADNYAEAIKRSGIKRVVFLSSIGAHLAEGNGIIQVYHTIESMLNDKLADVAITYMRPTSFYYNLLGYAGMIRKGFIAANYGEEKIVWVSPKDIAAAIADEIVQPLTGKKVRYVASDERTGDDTAKVLGAAIGNPGLKWTIITDEQSQSGLEAAGINPDIAKGLIEMYASIRSGKFWEDFYKNKPNPLGKVKLEDYAKDFADAYNQGEARDH